MIAASGFFQNSKKIDTLGNQNGYSLNQPKPYVSNKRISTSRKYKLHVDKTFAVWYQSLFHRISSVFIEDTTGHPLPFMCYIEKRAAFWKFVIDWQSNCHLTWFRTIHKHVNTYHMRSTGVKVYVKISVYLLKFENLLYSGYPWAT